MRACPAGSAGCADDPHLETVTPDGEESADHSVSACGPSSTPPRGRHAASHHAHLFTVFGVGPRVRLARCRSRSPRSLSSSFTVFVVSSWPCGSVILAAIVYKTSHRWGTWHSPVAKLQTSTQCPNPLPSVAESKGRVLTCHESVPRWAGQMMPRPTLRIALLLVCSSPLTGLTMALPTVLACCTRTTRRCR